MNKIFKELRIPFFTVLFIFFFLWLYAKFAPPLPFTVNSIQTTKQNLFSVDGTGTKTVAPDTAYISFGVTKTANTIADAQNQTNTATTNIINGLKNIGIDIKDIKTTNYSVNPNYNYSGQQQTISGYTVTQNMEITLKPLDKVNKATDVATANGANMVGGVTFGFDEATKKQLQQDVRQMAIKDAKEKAQSLANAGGLRLGRIVDIQENSNYNPPPIRFGALQTQAKTADSQSTDITPGQNNFTTTVTLSYETY